MKKLIEAVVTHFLADVELGATFAGRLCLSRCAKGLEGDRCVLSVVSDVPDDQIGGCDSSAVNLQFTVYSQSEETVIDSYEALKVCFKDKRFPIDGGHLIHCSLVRGFPPRMEDDEYWRCDMEFRFDVEDSTDAGS